MDIRTRSVVAALPLLAAGVTIFIWSSAFPAISYGLQAFAPAELALLRFLVASLVFALPVAFGLIKLPPRRDWPAVVVLALLGMSVYQLSLGYAMTRVPAGSAAVIVSIAPGVVAALAAMRLGEALGARILAGLAIAFVGAVFVTFGSGRAIHFEPMALLVLVAVFATSIYFVFQKPLLQRTTPIGFTAASVFVGTLGLLPFGVHLPEKLALASGAQVAGAIWLGIGPTVLGYLAWSFALSRAPVSVVSSFLYAQPLIAGVLAWLWLGQTMGALAIAGGALTLVGVLLTVRGAPKVAPVPKALPAPRKPHDLTCAIAPHGPAIQLR